MKTGLVGICLLKLRFQLPLTFNLAQVTYDKLATQYEYSFRTWNLFMILQGNVARLFITCKNYVEVSFYCCGSGFVQRTLEIRQPFWQNNHYLPEDHKPCSCWLVRETPLIVCIRDLVPFIFMEGVLSHEVRVSLEDCPGKQQNFNIALIYDFYK